MKVKFLPLSDFEQHRSEWERLQVKHYGVPILSVTFVQLLIKHFAHEGVQLLLVHEETAVLLLALVESRRAGVLTTWQPGQAPLGMLVYDRDVPLKDLMKAVASSRHFIGIIDLLQQDSRFCGLDALDPDFEMLPYIDTPWIECNTSFDEYWEALGKNLRRNTKKDLGKLEKQGSDPRFVVIDDPALVESAVGLHGELESSGWKGDMNSAIRSDNDQGRFYVDLLQSFCSGSDGFIYQYYYGDEIVASDFGISGANCAIILKTAYRQTIRDTSPAQLLRYHYFPILFEKFSGGRIEFYGKALDWHSRWTTSTRPIVHIEYHRLRLLRTAKNAVRAVRKLALG